MCSKCDAITDAMLSAIDRAGGPRIADVLVPEMFEVGPLETGQAVLIGVNASAAPMVLFDVQGWGRTETGEIQKRSAIVLDVPTMAAVRDTMDGMISRMPMEDQRRYTNHVSMLQKQRADHAGAKATDDVLPKTPYEGYDAGPVPADPEEHGEAAPTH